MTADIQLFHDGGPSVTMTAEDVTTGFASTPTAAVDLGTPGPIMLGFAFSLPMFGSAVDFVQLQCIWSHDNSVFGDLRNVDVIFSGKCAASTTLILTGAFPVKARYVKFRYFNGSGGTSDGTPAPTLVLTDLTYDQA